METGKPQSIKEGSALGEGLFGAGGRLLKSAPQVCFGGVVA